MRTPEEHGKHLSDTGQGGPLFNKSWTLHDNLRAQNIYNQAEDAKKDAQINRISYSYSSDTTPPVDGFFRIMFYIVAIVTNFLLLGTGDLGAIIGGTVGIWLFVAMVITTRDKIKMKKEKTII